MIAPDSIPQPNPGPNPYEAPNCDTAATRLNSDSVDSARLIWLACWTVAGIAITRRYAAQWLISIGDSTGLYSSTILGAGSGILFGILLHRLFFKVN